MVRRNGKQLYLNELSTHFPSLLWKTIERRSGNISMGDNFALFGWELKGRPVAPLLRLAEQQLFPGVRKTPAIASYLQIEPAQLFDHEIDEQPPSDRQLATEGMQHIGWKGWHREMGKHLH
jgi:hypothetical protein